jgi:alkanesulfonate monooxygenase SsuD/methylene tetrahydromethanopterin reductase-like flavin-dependent oxidoreductase (luciferase family)
MELAVQTRGPWDLVSATARWAEQNELAAIALPDHYLERGDELDTPAFDHYVHLAALARETSGIELVSLVSPVTFRHPAVFYKMAVTIDEVSDGRFTLGIGVGWLTEEFTLFGLDYPDRSTRYEMLDECFGYLRAALDGSTSPYSGRHYQLGEFDPRPRPANLRLLVGGGGAEKTPRLAGLYADEFNIYAGHPGYFTDRAATARGWAEEAGRDPSALFLSSASPAVAARKEADYRRILESHAAKTKSTPERIESVYEERGYPHGSGSKASEMLDALADAGCQRYYMQMFVRDLTVLDLALEAYQG